MPHPWTPPWRNGGLDKESLVVVSGDDGLRSSLEIGGDRSARARWVSRWLDAYLEGSSEMSPDEPDLSFFYVVWTRGPLGGPLGEVDGRHVLELGYGAEPAGPPDVPLVPFRDLAGAARQVLTAQGR